jgi:hypothetical protein
MKKASALIRRELVKYIGIIMPAGGAEKGAGAWVAMIHIETPRSKIQQVMGPGIGEAMTAAKAQGIGPVGQAPTRPIGAPNSVGR